MSHFVDPLLQRGFRVVAVDLPGHGQSSGRTFNLVLAVTALNAAIDKLGDFKLVVSPSLGGAVVATALAGTLPDQSKRCAQNLVLISAPDSMSKIFDDFAAMIGLTQKATVAFHAMVTELTGKVTDDFATGKQLIDRAAKLLLLHAPDDKEIPYSEAEAIAQVNPNATLAPAPGLGHRRIIASNDVVRTTVEFIARKAD